MKRLMVLLLVLLMAGCTLMPPKKPEPAVAAVEPPKREAPAPVLMPKGYKEPIAELIVICHRKKYECQRFMEKVPYEYDEHIEAYILPLVEANLAYPLHGRWYRQAYLDGRLFERVTTMPTFIVWEGSKQNGHELARWTGYTSMEEFLQQVNLMIEMYDLRQW